MLQKEENLQHFISVHLNSVLYITCLHSVLCCLFSCVFFTRLPPLSLFCCCCCIRQRPCVNISNQMHFFSSSFSTRTWCLFVFSLNLCHRIRYQASLNFLWAINSYCMVLYQSLMYNICITFLSFATAVRWSRHPARWFFYSRISHFFDEQSESWTKHNLESIPARMQTLSAALWRKINQEKYIMHRLWGHRRDPGATLGRPLAQSVRIWEQCHIHVTISFPMLSPIWKFPLKFLYFDIIKNTKEAFSSRVSSVMAAMTTGL